MRLYFSRAELLLHSVENEFVLEMAGKELARFSNEKKAMSEYNRIRKELETQLPPAAVSDDERRALLEKYVDDTLVGHNSGQAPRKKPARSRTFG